MAKAVIVNSRNGADTEVEVPGPPFPYAFERGGIWFKLLPEYYMLGKLVYCGYIPRDEEDKL